jgi:hypothetical protein
MLHPPKVPKQDGYGRLRLKIGYSQIWCFKISFFLLNGENSRVQYPPLTRPALALVDAEWNFPTWDSHRRQWTPRFQHWKHHPDTRDSWALRWDRTQHINTCW